MRIPVNHYANVEIYAGEWAEEAMRDYKNYPPMQVWDDSLKYIVWTVSGQIFPPFRPKLKDVEQVLKTLSDHAAMVISSDSTLSTDEKTRLIKGYRDGINEMWPRLQEKLLRNRGLHELMTTGGGAKSTTFAKFPTDLVPTAVALESAWGVNFGNDGRFAKFPFGDFSLRYITEPIFVELRRRTHYAQEVIKREYQRWRAHRDGRSFRVISLGAGLLIEFRKFDMSLDFLKKMDIVACDANKSLKNYLDTVFQYDLGGSFAESGIDYRFADISEVLNDRTLWGTANVVLMDGVLSYLKNKEEMAEYVKGMKRLLKPAGCIVCDLQILDISLVRCALVHEWKSTMSPELNAKVAISKIGWIGREAAMDYSVSVDNRNPKPLGVIAEFSLRRST